MNITNLPDEILRKIITTLPPNRYTVFNMVNTSIYKLGLVKLLIPWHIENYYGIDYDISYTERRSLYYEFIYGIPLNDFFNDIIIELNKINGDYTYYDNNIYTIKKRKEKNLYRTLFNIKPLQYKRDLEKNLYLRAII